MNTDKNNKTVIKDCLGCRLVGTVAFFGISIYLFHHGHRHTKIQNKLLVHSIGTGK